MLFIRTLMILSTLFSFEISAKVKYDRKERQKDVSLASGKKNDVRSYHATTTKVLNFPVTIVKDSILNFSDKCNNAYRKKRELTTADYDCKYHNENIIEQFVVKNLRNGTWKKEDHETERFVVAVKIYNRGESGHYDLVKIKETTNVLKQRTIIIEEDMLTNDQARDYVSVRFKKDSPFETSRIRYTLTEIAPGKTELRYIYKGTTTHWVLNKEISVPQVFSSLSKSINNLVSSIGSEAEVQTRSIASEAN
ncbi:MAG: hypothetical protein V4598_18170 [Bdellovibrionota bacterium]